MIKLVEISQSITFTPDMNVRSTKISIPWPTLVLVAVLGPIVVNGFRSNTVVTNNYSIPKDAVDTLDSPVKDVE